MAKFYVGQRVRFISKGTRLPYGSEGVIEIGYGYRGVQCTPRNDRYGVRFNGCPCDTPGSNGLWATREYCLAPLTDPKAEAFLESLKRLGREPRIDMPQVIQEHS